MNCKSFNHCALVFAVAATMTACSSDNNSRNRSTPSSPAVEMDPFAVSDWFDAASANPSLNNNRGVSAPIDDNGIPSGNTSSIENASFPLSTFAPGGVWNGNTISSEMTNTDYIGAINPDGSDNWYEDWTIVIEGNNSVWDANDQASVDNDGTLATCPAGTTLIMGETFNSLIGTLSNDEDGLITASGDMPVCQLPATISSDVTLTNNAVYRINQAAPGTLVGNGDKTSDRNYADVTLTIEEGTLIYGGDANALVITRGASVDINGTASNPVVMTSQQQLINRFDGVMSTSSNSARGEWAGFALMGEARSNECGDVNNCQVEAEGNIGSYGGIDDADSSGEIDYLVIRQAGNEISPDNELNGLTLFSVGYGTNIDYVQIHRGSDDGFEHFGSSNFVTHMVVTGADDDSVDWGQGWTGGAQWVLVVQEAGAGDHGIEADNDGDDPNADPISNPLLANMTFVTSNEDSAILLRRGTRAQIHNTIVAGLNSTGCEGIDLDDNATFERALENGGMAANPSLSLVMRNALLECDPAFVDD